MDGFLIIIGIVWLVLSAVTKKKKREAAEAAKRARAETDAQASPAFPGEGEASPVMPDSFPAASPASAPEKPFDPFFGGLDAPVQKPAAPTQKPAAPVQASAPAPWQADARAAMRPTQTASSLSASFRHTLEASSLSGGHTHMESSLSGLENECPPAKAPASPAAVTPASGNTAFRWNASDARTGLVLSEILGKPVALRR